MSPKVLYNLPLFKGVYHTPMIESFSNVNACMVHMLHTMVVAMLKSQYNGITCGFNGVERQLLAFIQQCSTSPLLELMGLHIRWNYLVPSRICL